MSDGRTNGWTVTARRGAPIVIQIAAAYKRRQKFRVLEGARDKRVFVLAGFKRTVVSFLPCFRFENRDTRRRLSKSFKVGKRLENAFEQNRPPDFSPTVREARGFFYVRGRPRGCSPREK